MIDQRMKNLLEAFFSTMPDDMLPHALKRAQACDCDGRIVDQGDCRKK
jgi:hypothetical protein